MNAWKIPFVTGIRTSGQNLKVRSSRWLKHPDFYALVFVGINPDDAAWGIDVLHGDLVGRRHHQATFGRRNPIAAHDNNNLVMNAGEWAG